MSYLTVDGKKNFIFGKDGVKKESDKLNFKYLGEVPIFQEISQSCDNGKPICAFNDNDVIKIFDKISEKFLDSFSQKLRLMKLKLRLSQRSKIFFIFSNSLRLISDPSVFLFFIMFLKYLTASEDNVRESNLFLIKAS